MATQLITQKLTSTPPETITSSHSRGYAWYVVFVLLLCYTLSFVDRQILSLLVGPIKRDLLVSDTRVGLLQGFAFAIFYTLTGLPIGRFVDTYSRRTPILIGVFLWSVMTALCSIARSFWSLFAARVGVGVGEAALSPAGLSLIADYFPRESLSVALSVYQMGIFIGSGLALVLGGAVVDTVVHLPATHVPLLGVVPTWRLTFLIVGVPGLVVGLIVLTVREPVRQTLLRKADGGVEQLALRDVFAQIYARWQSFGGLAVGMITETMSTFGFLAWAPAFFQRKFGWTAGHIGRELGILVFLLGCSGMYFGGLLCRRWQRRGMYEAPLKIGVISAAGTCIFLGAALLPSNPIECLILAGIGLFFLGMPVGNAFAALQLVFPNQVRGQVSALLMFIINLGGIGLGPLLPGLFNDYLFHNEKMVGFSVSLTMVLASLLTLIIFPLTYRHYRRDYEALHLVRSA